MGRDVEVFLHAWMMGACVLWNALLLKSMHSRVQVKKLQEQQLKPKEQVTLEPYERDHAMVVGVFRPPPKVKPA